MPRFPRRGSGGTSLDDAQVLDPPERRAGARQLVGLLGHAQQADGPMVGAEDREQRLGLGDRRPEVALRVLDEQRRPDPVGVGDRRDLAEVGRVLPGRRLELEPRPVAAGDVAGREQDRSCR